MDKPIMLSPHDLWNIMLAICGAIVAISAAVAVVLKIVEHFKLPDKKQNDRIDTLETKVGNIELRLEQGDRHFAEHDDQMRKIEETMRKTNKLIIESLKALIEHDIDGNNIEGLKEKNHKIDEFLLEK